jgi:hypothetical protein
LTGTAGFSTALLLRTRVFRDVALLPVVCFPTFRRYTLPSSSRVVQCTNNEAPGSFGISRNKPSNASSRRKTCVLIRGQLKCDGTRAETRCRLLAKRTSPFKSARGVTSVEYWQPKCAHQLSLLVLMPDTSCFEVVSRVMATHSNSPVSPSLPLPCVTVCHHISTGLSFTGFSRYATTRLTGQR